MCGIWCNAKVTFLQLCSKEILGESHCCGRMRNEGRKQILPLRAIILYKLLGTSIPPEPRAGGGLQHPLATAVWQELGWEPASCAPSKAHWARWARAQAVVSTSRILWISAIDACPDICSAGRGEEHNACLYDYMAWWSQVLTFVLHMAQNYGKEHIMEWGEEMNIYGGFS